MSDQDLTGAHAALRVAQDEPRRVKAAAERYRKWLHALAWPTLFLTVVMTDPSIRDPRLGAAVVVASYALVTAGTVGRLWCALYVRGRKSKNLCQYGPYSMCRNPLYLSVMLSIIGVALASERAILMGVFPVLFGACYLAVILSEERRMAVLFGGEYQAYRARVPRIIPRPGLYRSEEAVVADPENYVIGAAKSMGYLALLFLLLLVQRL